MSKSEEYKSGEKVEQSGVYTNEWGVSKILKEGSTFPQDAAMGDTTWKLIHYPFDSQVTSKNVPEGFRNEISNQTKDKE